MCRLFTARSYNSFIQKIVNAVTAVPVRVSSRTVKSFPIMQINSAAIAKLLDDYIRQKLFGAEFDPLQGNNWRILLLTEARIIQHIVRNVAKSIYDLQNSLKISEAKILKRLFSEVSQVRIRDTYAVNVAKTIYPKISFPSHKGGFEKKFMEFIDTDAKVKCFMKINEYNHDFANIIYVRDDGMLANYYPDFIARIDDKMYLVETKAQRDLKDVNVTQKRLATVDWIDKVNALNSDDRMNCSWSYALLGEDTFYGMSQKGADTQEILEYAILTKAKIKGTLADLVGLREY